MVGDKLEIKENIWERKILETVKESIGVAVDDNAFDEEILTHINGSLGAVLQVGVGKPIYVVDNTYTWGNFFNAEDPLGVYVMVLQYVFIKVKVLFDPPAPATLNVMTNYLDELLFRIQVSKSVE